MVALDTSASVSAPGRLARAKQLAREAIGRAPSAHLVAVVTFADTAQIAAAPSADRALAVSAIDAATSGFGATKYRAALTTAADLVGSSGGAENVLVVVTDLQQSGWDRGDHVAMPESVRVELADVGALPPNLAVTEVRPAPDGRLVATVRNHGSARREASVRLAIDGQPAGDRRTPIGPDEAAEVSFAGARGAAAAVSVEDADGLQADNVRYAVLDNTARPTVLFVTAGGDLERDAFYAQEALTAAGTSGSTYQAQGVAAAQLSTWTGPRLDSFSAVVMMSTRGLERRGRELLADYVRRGGGMLMAVGPGVDGEVATETVDRLISIAVPSELPPKDPRGQGRSLVPADARHPVFRALGAGRGTLGLVTFERVATIRGAGCHTLARFTTGEAALVECAPGEGLALVFASDLDNAWNDFPLHATFVPFLHEAVRHLAGRRVRAGDYLVGEAPEGVPSQPGVVTLPARTGAPERRIAINVDPLESDPVRLSGEEFQAAITRINTTAAVREMLSLDRRRTASRSGGIC